MKRSMKSGFTLAEVLITLAVIGVVAAMSIPALIGTTNQQEFKVGLKKAVAVLNQAITMSIALDATDASQCANCANAGATTSTLATGDTALANYFKTRLNVIANGPNTNNSFYTADGMLYRFYHSAAATACGPTGEGSDGAAGTWGVGLTGATASAVPTAANCVVLVDVNGAKGPNMLSTGSGGTNNVYKDQYYLVIRAQNVTTAGNASYTVAQDAMSN